MIRRSTLVTAMATAIANIPELEGELVLDAPVVPYIDLTPDRKNVEDALYQMAQGQVLVIWVETILIQQETSKWSHRVEICVRALKDHSDMDLADLIMNGIPVPGDGMIWRMCPLISGVLPTDVLGISRRTDTEGVDYHVILTETAETGDWPLP